jgi:tetratricopeptide (TPR) repeat protein
MKQLARRLKKSREFLLFCAAAVISLGLIIRPVPSVQRSILSGKTAQPRSVAFAQPTKIPAGQTGGDGQVDENVTVLVIDSEDTPEKVSRLMREAAFFYKKQCYPKAQKRLEQVLRYDPANEQAMNAKIEVKNEWEDSINPSQKTLQSAQKLFATSDFAGAAQSYLQFLAQYPQSKKQIQPLVIKCYYNLGIISLRRGGCELASQYFQQNLAMDPENAETKRAMLLVNDCRAPGSPGRFLALPLVQ